MSSLACGQPLDQQERLRTVFVSDLHLGSRYCHAERFLDFLERHEIQQLYLVGDIIDGWRLRRSWRWPAVYHRIFQRLLRMSMEGTELFYTPGNHDEFLRHYLRDFGFIDVADEFIHEAIDQRRFLVTHGDRFDQVEKSCKWLSSIGASLYEFLMWTNFAVNKLRAACRLQECHYSGRVKMSFKRAVKYVSDFESEVAHHAQRQNCEGVICGHIHAPAMQEIDGVTYCNTGDWVEHCTALVEHSDGSWRLLDYLPNSSEHSVPSSDDDDQRPHPKDLPVPRRMSRRQLAATT